jgi:hypothetical protein
MAFEIAKGVAQEAIDLAKAFLHLRPGFTPGPFSLREMLGPLPALQLANSVQQCFVGQALCCEFYLRDLGLADPNISD